MCGAFNTDHRGPAVDGRVRSIVHQSKDAAFPLALHLTDLRTPVRIVEATIHRAAKWVRGAVSGLELSLLGKDSLPLGTIRLEANGARGDEVSQFYAAYNARSERELFGKPILSYVQGAYAVGVAVSEEIIAHYHGENLRKEN